MKVIVGKMPGGRAQQIEVQEGSTVLDAVKAAGYEADLNSGYEARLNNQPTTLSTIISPNSIISLAQKITGNAPAPIEILSIFSVEEKYPAIKSSMMLSDVPVHLNDFLQYTDVKGEIEHLVDYACSNVFMAAVLHGDKLSAPQSIILDGKGNIIVFANGIEIHREDTVCIFPTDSVSTLYSDGEYEAANKIREAIASQAECEEDDECIEDDECMENDDSEECSGCCSCGHTEISDITLQELANICRKTGVIMHLDIPIIEYPTI